MTRRGRWAAAVALVCGVTAAAQDPKADPPDDPKTPFGWRTGPAKGKLLADAGGTADSEAAVDRGLDWLTRTQRKDGAWTQEGMGKDDTTTPTAMALLAYLGAGHSHRDGKHQKAVAGGLKHLAAAQDKFGKFKGQSMYVHGIATIAACEAYGLTRDPAVRKTAVAAVAYIQKNQGADGSWGYQGGTNGDTSIVGWQVQALTAAQRAGLPVDAKVLKKASAFLDKVGSGPRKAVYGYTSPTGFAGTALTAIGILSRTALDGWKPDNPAVVEGVQGLLKRAAVVGNRPPDMYFYYYATQLARYAGGPDWQTWNEGPERDGKRQGGMRDALPKLQVIQGGDAGSWDPDVSFVGQWCGRHGTTCLCVLTLEVYYRNPPGK